MKRLRTRIIIIALTIVQMEAFGQLFTYQLDNGNISTALNASDTFEPRDNWFANEFTAQADRSLITEVQFGVFTTTPGSVADVAIYRVTDLGGNPALGATLLYTQPFTPLAGNGANAFLQNISLSTPVALNPGDKFLVAVMVKDVIALPPNDVYPFLLDTSGVATGSYWDRSNPNSFNLDDISGAKLLNQPLTPGGMVPGSDHVFIRALGEIPEPTGTPMVFAAITLAVVITRRFWP